MSAACKAIRKAIQARLLGQTDAGTRVFTNRAEALHHVEGGGEIPAIVIYTLSESSERFQSSPLAFEVTPRVGVECITNRKSVAPVDDDIDDLCEQVLARVISDPTAGATSEIKSFRYVGRDVAVDSQGYELMGGARLNFEYGYVAEYAQEVPPPEEEAFTGYDADFNTDLIAPAIQAQGY